MRYRLTLLFLHLCMFMALVFGYESFIVPLYGYEGYVFQPNIANGYAAVVAIAMLSFITPATFKKPSTLFFHLTLVFVVIPMLVLFYAEGKDWEYPAQVVAAYIFSVLLLRFIKVNPPSFSYPPKYTLQRMLLLMVLVYLGSIFAMGGGAYLNFDLTKVYDFRTDAANNLPGVFGYISPPMGKVVVPIGLVLSLIYKRYASAFLYLISAVLIFGLTANKAPLFNPFLVLFIYLISSSKNLTVKFNVGILIVILLSIGDFWMAVNQDNSNGSFGWVGSLMLARMFFLPPEINYMYYDFFSNHEWVFFSDSKITLGLLNYPYPLDAPHLIGRYYFNSDITSANTGWIGSGYMHAGFAGMLAYAALTAVIFKYVDACARRSGELGLVTASIVIPIFSLVTASDLPTTILTHGLWANMILIACFQKRYPNGYAAPFRIGLSAQAVGSRP
ncbi:hypothetical protein [Noviherbaspirillum massiliense]|uniref:hypothetical protein n=1 Tax=Noviherbaspirillum massiliense TaxID=1465823 RepID=UPI0002EA0AF3|nr:hypothetical protein [Noviherbaspirillum massiliense]